MKFISNRIHLLLTLLIASLCTTGCATPLIALGSSAAGAGMQALGGVTGAAGMSLIGDKVSDTLQNYMGGGDHVADVTYETRPASLERLVDRTLHNIVTSPFVALQYTTTDHEDLRSFVLLTSSGSELRIDVQDDPEFDYARATQMIVDMELAESESQEIDSSVLIDALNEIESNTQKRGMEKIRGEFNYVAGLMGYVIDEQQFKVAQSQQG